jgi:hypothetical protein
LSIVFILGFNKLFASFALLKSIVKPTSCWTDRYFGKGTLQPENDLLYDEGWVMWDIG